MLLFVVALITACKDDEKPERFFIYKGQKISLAKGFLVNLGSYTDGDDEYFEWGVAFASNGVDIEDSESFTGQGDLILISLDVLNDDSRLPAGTYTFDPAEGEHLADGSVVFINFNFGDLGDDGNTVYEDIDEMEVVVTKSGSNFTITYTLEFAEGETITGKFQGALTDVED